MTFESLLVKELQKQQRRAEFCDVVLHTQGVSVPVHSCVLSAFSPWLCGALSVMPSPEKQKRLIEVQAVEACTLLSLVTLLYSGQLNEEKEEVLSAACKLGITIPQQDITTIVSQAGTQTEYMKESVERECQTEVHYTSTLSLLSECPHPKETVETVNLIGLSSWRSDQGLDQYATATADITLTTLQNVQGIPEKLSSFQVMDVVPETSLCPTDQAPPTKRPRGRPRKHPLPPPNAARSGMSAPAEKATNPPAPSLMHTAALPTANQPLDWLIDDVIAQLPFMPPITSSIQNNQTSVKVTDLCVVQSQPEGELTDILDSFLRTFDQHVGSCDSDVLQTWPKGQRERLNSYSKPTFGTVGSPSEYNSRGSDAMGCRTEADPAVPLEKPRDTQCITDTSEDDVDVVEVSSTLSESSNVLPLIADIVISTEEDDTEEEEIDILDYT